MKVIDIIRRSMRVIGVLGVGEVPSSEETSDCIFALNQLIENWNLNALMIYASETQKFNLSPGQASYGWGLTGDFDAQRPDRVDRGYIISQQIKYEIPKVEAEYYASLSSQPDAGIPNIFYYNPTFPLGTLNIYPPPDAPYEMEFLIFKKIPIVENPDDDLIMPDGYGRALVYNLGLEIAPEFGVQVTELLVKNANESLANVKRRNIRPAISQTEIPLAQINAYGTYDITKG